MGRLTIHVDNLPGLRAPFTRSVRIAELTYEGPGPLADGHTFRPSYALVAQHVQALVGTWGSEWYEPRLKSLDEIEPGRWRVEIEEPYLD